MADETYKIAIDTEKTGTGGQQTVQELEAVKSAAVSTATALKSIPPKVIDTTEFKDLAAGLNEAGSAADRQTEKLNNFKEAAGGIRLAAQGGPVAILGLTRAIEGIGKAAGVSKEALSDLIGKLGAAGAGFAIGSAIGDAIYKNIVTPIWDAVDAYEALHDPATKAYEQQKAIRREFIELNNVRLEDARKKVEAIAKELENAAKRANTTKSALDELNAGQQELELANIKFDETSGKISAQEAARQRLIIQYTKDRLALLAELAEAQKALEVETNTGYFASDMEAMKTRVEAVMKRIEAARINYDADNYAINAREAAAKTEAAGKALSESAKKAGEGVKSSGEKSAADVDEAASTLGGAVDHMGGKMRKAADDLAALDSLYKQVEADTYRAMGESGSGSNYRAMGESGEGHGGGGAHVIPNSGGWGGTGGNWTIKNPVVQSSAGDIGSMSSFSGGSIGGGDSLDLQMTKLQDTIREYEKALLTARGNEYDRLVGAIQQMNEAFNKAELERKASIARLESQIKNSRW